MSHLTPVPSDPEALQAWLQQSGSLGFEENVEIELPDPPPIVRALTVEVTLRHSEPPIWRRLVVAGDTTLDAFHEVLQIAMGWTDSHLHRFFPDSEDLVPYFVTEYDVEEGDEGTPEETVRVDQLLRAPGDRLRYEYDFGDGWTHDVRLDSVADLSGDSLPLCIDGARACPPEDVGGPGAYAELVAWHRAGRPVAALPAQFESLEHAVDWLPNDFDPDAFDAADVDLRLRAADAAQALIEGLRPELVDLLSRLDPVGAELAMRWLTAVPAEPPTSEDLAAATLHWRVLLEAVGDGVRLTSAGYLPPTVVQQVFEAVSPGERWYSKGNRENHAPPVARIRVAAQQLGLLRKAKGVLAPTTKALEVEGNPAALLAHVASRLPLGKAEVEQEAGWFALLGLAAGVSDEDLYDGILTLLSSRGWRMSDGRPLESYDVRDLTRLTIVAASGPGSYFSIRGAQPEWVPRIVARIVNTRQS